MSRFAGLGLKRPLEGADGAGPAKAPNLGDDSGQTTVTMEIPQTKVPAILGDRAATIKAIKQISGALVLIKERTPGPNLASLTVCGQPAQVDKCKGLIMALVNGGALVGNGVIGGHTPPSQPEPRSEPVHHPPKFKSVPQSNAGGGFSSFGATAALSSVGTALPAAGALKLPTILPTVQGSSPAPGLGGSLAGAPTLGTTLATSTALANLGLGAGGPGGGALGGGALGGSTLGAGALAGGALGGGAFGSATLGGGALGALAGGPLGGAGPLASSMPAFGFGALATAKPALPGLALPTPSPLNSAFGVGALGGALGAGSIPGLAGLGGGAAGIAGILAQAQAKAKAEAQKPSSGNGGGGGVGPGTANLSSVDAAKVQALLTGAITAQHNSSGGANSSGAGDNGYFALISAAMQLAGNTSTEDEEPKKEKKEEVAAFDKDALAKLAKQAQEDQDREEIFTSRWDERASETVESSEPPPSKPDLPGGWDQPPATVPAVLPAALGIPSLLDLEVLKSPLQMRLEQEQGPLTRLPVSTQVVPRDFARLAQLRQAAAAAGGAPVMPTVVGASPAVPNVAAAAAAAAGFLDGRPASVPAIAKKDSSSVMAMLQQAQENAARGREGNARAGQFLSQFGENQNAAPQQPQAPQWDALDRRLQHAAAAADTRRAMEKEVVAMLSKLEPARSAELVGRVHNVEGMRSGTFLDEVCRALVPVVQKFGSPPLTKVTCILCQWAIQVRDSGKSKDKSGVSEDVRAFCAAVSAEVSLRLMEVAPGDLTKIASSLASVNLGGVRLFASLARAAVARSEKFSPKELVELCQAFDSARFFHTALFEALSGCLKANVKEMAPRDVMKGMCVLATAGVKDEELGQLIGDAVPNKAKSGALTAEEFCTLAWTFCVLDLQHDRLFRAVFKAMEDAEVVGNDTLIQLYEIHTSLKTFHQGEYAAYELDADAVESLMDHYKANKTGPKKDRSAERVRSDIAEICREVVDGSMKQSERTELGFPVDFAVTRRKTGAVLAYLEVDDLQTLTRSLDPSDTGQTASQTSRVRGATALKRRVLRQQGVEVAVVTEDEWRALEESRDKRDCVRNAFKAAGLPSERFL